MCDREEGGTKKRRDDKCNGEGVNEKERMNALIESEIAG